MRWSEKPEILDRYQSVAQKGVEAQKVERLTVNQMDIGSTPMCPAYALVAQCEDAPGF